MAKKTKWAWACPKCGMDHKGKHSTKVPASHCIASLLSGSEGCSGFLCECEGGDAPNHGDTPATACPEANCYHCGWGGTWPPLPKKMTAWEKQALAAGWTPPAEWGGR